VYIITTQKADDRSAAIYSEIKAIMEHDVALFHCYVSSVVHRIKSYGRQTNTISGDESIAFLFRTQKIIDYVAAFLVVMVGNISIMPSLEQERKALMTLGNESWRLKLHL
jgi:hypothetical protein